MRTRAIPLSTTPQDRFAKRSALAVFRSLRVGLHYLQQAPGAIQGIAADVAEAWRESAIPKP